MPIVKKNDPPRGRLRHARLPIVRGIAKSMLRTCALEQLGNGLRRAERDLVCVMESAALDYRLDFEIWVTAPSRPQAFVNEHRYFGHTVSSQRCSERNIIPELELCFS